MAVFPPTCSGQKLTSSLHCGRNSPGAAEYESWHRSRLWPCSPWVLEEFGSQSTNLAVMLFLQDHCCKRMLQKIWRKPKVTAIEKPGKDPRLVESYSPISLLSTCYKLIEHLILHRVSPEVEKLLSPKQVGFGRYHSTCKQVTALTTHIENWFQEQLKSRCIVSGPNSSLWYRVGYWTPIQVEQEHVTLVCPSDWAILTWPTSQGAYWQRHQRLENSGEWASSGVGAITNTLQPLHQQPSCNWVSKVYICRRHLLDKASTEVGIAGISDVNLPVKNVSG